ncbi:MAG: response regulator [Pseudomonadales bacterium]|nr:response regulator [Pseudomonadales bacterium]
MYSENTRPEEHRPTIQTVSTTPLQNLPKLRQEVCSVCLKLFILIGLPVVLLSFHDHDPGQYFHMSIWLLVLAAFLIDTRQPRLSAMLLIASFYALGVSELVSDGKNGSHREVFMLVTFLASSLISTRAGVYGLISCLATTLILTLLIGTGIIDLMADTTGYPAHWSGWLVESLYLLFLAGGILGATAYLMNNLELSLSQATDLVEQLKQEISEKQTAIANSVQKEKMYRLLANNVTDVVCILDLDLSITYSSPSILTQRGLTVAEVLNTGFFSGISPATLGTVNTAIQTIFSAMVNKSEHTFYEIEFELQHNDGHYLWIEGLISLIRNAEGEPDYLLCVNRDITQRKEAETDKQILQDQVRHIQRIDSLGQLAGGLAHDFNNILVAIMGYTELNLLDPAKNEARENLEGTLEAAHRASKLTHQLLAFGRQQQFNLEVFDLNNLIGKLEDMLSRLIRQDIVLAIYPAIEPVFIEADHGQIEQIIVNLIINARDAMPNGGNLSILTEVVSSDEQYLQQQPTRLADNYIKMTISDEGCGINTAQLDQLFEPFYTTKAVGMGTGLGLSVAYGITTQHNGFITAAANTATNNTGTDFIVYLPQSIANIKTQPLDIPDKYITQGSETILLVDDDEPVRTIALRMLKRAGYKVIIATDGLEALSLYREHQKNIHLILLDIIMPNMGGKELAGILRTMQTDVPILFCSGYYYDAEQANFIQDQGYALLKKPYTQDKLLNKIREVINQQAAKIAVS